MPANEANPIYPSDRESFPDEATWLRVLHQQVRSPSTTGDEHP